MRGRPAADTVEDYLWFTSRGYGRREIADRLGIKYRSLLRALQRARKRGLLGG